MKNYRSEGCGAIHRFSIRKDSEHGICIAVRLPIPRISRYERGTPL